MKSVHQSNIVMIWVCVAMLSIFSILSYGTSGQGVAAAAILIVTGVIVTILWKLEIKDFIKALCIVLIPSYAILLYSFAMGGNSVSFLAGFITLGMAARYFDKKLIQYYAVPYVAVCLVIAVCKSNVLAEFGVVDALVRVVIFAVTSYLFYKGTAFGEEKINVVKEQQGQIRDNQEIVGGVVEALNREIAGCSRDVQQVHIQASQVSESSEQMSLIMEQASETLQQINDKVNSSMGQIEKNYEYAKQLEESFGIVNQAVEKSNHAAREARATMEEMGETVGTAQQVTDELKDRMGDITEILDKIDSIAKQTNLLSLNASIEAARAGEHGRGFAVVADEIRALSEESSEASRNIQGILEGLAQMAGDVATKVELGADAAKESSDQIAGLMQIMENIVGAAEEANELVGQEYRAIEQVKTEFESIQEELTTVASTSEENSSMIIEITANIRNQGKAVNHISGSMDKIQKSSERLESYFQ